MKKFLFFISFVFFLLPFTVKAQETNIYIFYGDGCPHCAALEKYLDTKYNNDQDIKIYKYEVWYNTNNQKLWEDVQKTTGKQAKGVPYFIIGDKVYQGYNETSSWEETVDNAIKNAKTVEYDDDVGVTLGVIKESEKHHEGKKQEQKEDQPTTVDIPLIGTMELKNVSLPIAAVVIGLVDGFNPCAMWILIFLITMLFDYKDKKKMWILGGAFLLTSAAVYFAFLLGITEIGSKIGKSIADNNLNKNLLRIPIAIFALSFGVFNIYRYFKTRKTAGCDIVDKDQRKKIMIRIKDVLSRSNFFLALLGIMLLAISVNLIELGCSAGLPAIFATLLIDVNHVANNEKLIYIGIYILFFLLDDLIVFIIAMKTLKIKAISNKYTKYSHLIGGIIMIAIGILMIFKPAWLMLNF